MQVSLYTTEGLERATDALNKVTQHWNFYSIGSTVSCWLAIAAATTVRVSIPLNAEKTNSSIFIAFVWFFFPSHNVLPYIL
jgi:hypothetical protein